MQYQWTNCLAVEVNHWSPLIICTQSYCSCERTYSMCSHSQKCMGPEVTSDKSFSTTLLHFKHIGAYTHHSGVQKPFTLAFSGHLANASISLSVHNQYFKRALTQISSIWKATCIEQKIYNKEGGQHSQSSFSVHLTSVSFLQTINLIRYKQAYK